MAKTVVIKPLGLVLRKAGLISSAQVEIALKESLGLPKYKIGEILAIRGWIKPETADFFAEIWPYIIKSKSNHQKEITDTELILDYSLRSSVFKNSRMGSFPQTNDKLRNLATSQINLNNQSAIAKASKFNQKESLNQNMQPLGQYLKAASLINEQQIDRILNIQKNSSANFGKIAVEQGLISQDTLDFFLRHLNLIKTGELIKIYPEAIALELDRIENYLLHNQRCEPINLLQTYGKIREKGIAVAKNNLAEQELLASGIVTLDNNIIRITKPIYQANFDEEWLERELANLKPYNQIRLKMFDLDRKAVIPYKIINTVNHWSNHQHFLTQKIYQIIKAEFIYVLPGEEETVIEELIYKYLIENWQNGVAAKHFQTISDRILKNNNCSTETLLKSYKKIWQLKEINANNSREQTELLRIGLIKLENNRVSLSNPIYQAVFDLQWIEKQLSKLKLSKGSDLETRSANKLLTVSQKVSSGRKKYILLTIAIVVLAIPLLKFLVVSQSPSKELREPNSYLKKLDK
jgi:hypothetical protein